MQLEATQVEVAQTRSELTKQQQANSQLKQVAAELETKVERLGDQLEETNSKLSEETTKGADAKKHLTELKREYIAAGDKLESEQTVIRSMRVRAARSHCCTHGVYREPQCDSKR